MRNPQALCTTLLLSACLLLCAGWPALTVAADGPNQVAIQASTHADLQASLDALAQRARPGHLGITVLDLSSHSQWRVNASSAYPMMSVFKAPLAAVVLAQVDQGRLSLQQQVVITRAEVVDGTAVPSIGTHFHGERMSFSVERLLVAAVSESDSTAADALMKTVGGADVVTAFLREHGIAGMRVDLDEAGVESIFQDLPQGVQPAADETTQQTLRRHQRGFQAFLADPRNRSTPDAAADFLDKLWRRQLLSPESSQRLLNLLYAQTIPNRLRRGLPAQIKLADKCGTAKGLEGRTAAYNDIGILSLPNGHTVIVAAFLTDSTAKDIDLEALYADLGRSVVTALQP
ncbi:class A beta-lactamase [Dyella silvatica]|uniref:class A beta-lactamase n=1 Tax=Dyella silvatica TaxID=2992128 RepID=UPI0022572DBD|nr:class A beta-lactamase [Dyella silvatica]